MYWLVILLYWSNYICFLFKVSIESTNSFSEPDEAHENLAPQLKSLKEDPETKKKKEIHKNLMSEALKKVELRNIQKKQFQLSRFL